MKIIVCIKQVPATNKAEIDPETGTIIRSGIASKMNPFDLFAIETALRLKEENGGSVDVITMGPPMAAEVVKEAIAIGADNGYVISDRAFAGSDVLATSYTISQGIKACGDYDIVFCGQQTTDGDTAQVGAELAEFLGFDHACYVTGIKVNKADSQKSELEISVDLGSKVLRQTISSPCVLTIARDTNTPRLPSYKRKCKYCNKEIKMISLDDFADKDKGHYGLDGSPTSVEKIFPPDNSVDNIELDGNAEQKATAIVDKIKEMKLF